MKRRKASIQSNTCASVLSQAKIWREREKQSKREWMKANRRGGKKQQQRMTRKQYVAN